MWVAKIETGLTLNPTGFKLTSLLNEVEDVSTPGTGQNCS